MSHSDSPDALIEALKDLEPAKADTAEPGIVWRQPDWIWPWASEAYAKAEGVEHPMLRKHLRSLKFRSFTRDAAGLLAFERAGQEVLAYQARLKNENPIIADDAPAVDPNAPSSTRIVRR